MASRRVLLDTTVRVASPWPTEPVTGRICERRGESLAVFVLGSVRRNCAPQLIRPPSERSAATTHDRKFSLAQIDLCVSLNFHSPNSITGKIAGFLPPKTVKRSSE